MVKYLLLRVANYAVLLFIAVSLAWVLAQTQLHPRQLFQQHTPPLSPQSIENAPAAAASLPPVEECADSEALGAILPLPREPEPLPNPSGS